LVLKVLQDFIVGWYLHVVSSRGAVQHETLIDLIYPILAARTGRTRHCVTVTTERLDARTNLFDKSEPPGGLLLVSRNLRGPPTILALVRSIMISAATTEQRGQQ
jgi:hypothetical protein